MKISKPNPDEHADYYGKYINRVTTDDPLTELKQSGRKLVKLISKLSKKQLHYRYAEGKWSILEILQHIMDAERVFTYRAMRIARNDKTALPGFDENVYATESKGDSRKVKSLLKEYEALRSSTIALFESFDEEMVMQLGTASNHPISVRALMYIVLGHELHHIGVIKEKYLTVSSGK